MIIRGSICRSCIYYAVSMGCCDYAEMTGKCRTVRDGKIRTDIKENQCNEYVRNERSRDVNWAVEKRINWYKNKNSY